MEIRRTWNPLTLADDFQVYQAESGKTPAQIIEECGLVFKRPYYLLVNGRPVGRAEWNSFVLSESHVCHFVELPHGGGGGGSNPLQVVGMLAVLALAPWAGAMLTPGVLGIGGLATTILSAGIAIGGMALVNSFFAQTPDTPASAASLPSPETVYSISAGTNSRRVGAPIPEQFGRFKCFPDLLQMPYVEYCDKTTGGRQTDFGTYSGGTVQYLNFFGVVGLGEYELEDVFIDDTPIGNFPNSSYSFLDPDESPTLISRIVWPTNAVSGIELTTDYVQCIVNPSGTETSEVHVDLYAPSGIFSIATTGAQTYAFVAIDIEARLVDDYGDPLGEWETCIDSSVSASKRKGGYTQTCSVNPMMCTKILAPTAGPGRYELRLSRTENAGAAWNTANWVTDRQNNAVYIGQIKAFGAPHGSYSDVTCLEVRAQSSNQLTGDVANRISVVSTRKLYPVGESGFGGEKAVSRSIVDAVAYIVTSSNGGKQADSVLDFDSLYELETEYADSSGGLDYTFDWRFANRTNVMAAITKAAACGLAVPYLPNGKLTLVRDQAQTSEYVYSENDIDDGSLEIEHIVRTDDDPTCVTVQYTNPVTWEQAEIECYDSDGSDENPAVVPLEGVSDATQAEEIGWYRYYDDLLCRTMVTFTTGLKGHIPPPGSKLLVPAPQTNWGASGLIQAIDGTDIYLDTPVDFDGEADGVLYITSITGGGLGPYVVTPGDDDLHITSALPVETKTIAGDGDDAVKFVFGVRSSDILPIRLNRIVPDSPSKIRMQGSLYDAAIYNQGQTPAPASLALLYDVQIFYRGISSDSDEAYRFYMTWAGTADQVLIEIDTGSGYEELVDELEAHGYAFEVTEDVESVSLWVSPYDSGEADSGEGMGVTYNVTNTVTGLAISGENTNEWTVSWDAADSSDGVTSYIIRVYSNDSARNLLGSFEADGDVSERTITEGEIRSMGGPLEDWILTIAARIGADEGRESDDVSAELGDAGEVAIETLAFTDGGDLEFSFSYNESAAAAFGFDHYLIEIYDNTSDAVLLRSFTQDAKGPSKYPGFPFSLPSPNKVYVYTLEQNREDSGGVTATAEIEVSIKTVSLFDVESDGDTDTATMTKEVTLGTLQVYARSGSGPPSIGSASGHFDNPTPPSGWSVTIPAGSAWLWTAFATFDAFDGWSEFTPPIPYSATKSYIIVDPNGYGDFTDLEEAFESIDTDSDAAGVGVYIRNGTYNLSDTITVPDIDIDILGETMFGVRIFSSGVFLDNYCFGFSADGYSHVCRIYNLSLVCGGDTSGTLLTSFGTPDNEGSVYVESVYCETLYFYMRGIDLQKFQGATSIKSCIVVGPTEVYRPNSGIAANNCKDLTIEGCVVEGGFYSGISAGSSWDRSGSLARIIGNRVSCGKGIGINTSFDWDVIIRDNKVSMALTSENTDSLGGDCVGIQTSSPYDGTVAMNQEVTGNTVIITAETGTVSSYLRGIRLAAYASKALSNVVTISGDHEGTSIGIYGHSPSLEIKNNKITIDNDSNDSADGEHIGVLIRQTDSSVSGNTIDMTNSGALDICIKFDDSYPEISTDPDDGDATENYFMNYGEDVVNEGDNNIVEPNYVSGSFLPISPGSVGRDLGF